MRQKIDLYFSHITGILDNLTSKLIADAPKSDPEKMKTFTDFLYVEFFHPVAAVGEELEMAELARKYLLKLGGLNTSILSKEESDKLLYWVEHSLNDEIDNLDNEFKDSEKAEKSTKNDTDNKNLVS